MSHTIVYPQTYCVALWYYQDPARIIWPIFSYWLFGLFFLCSVHGHFRVSGSKISSAVITWLDMTSVKLVFMWLNGHDVTWAASISQMETDTYSAASSKWRTQCVVFGAKLVQSQNIQPSSSYEPLSHWFLWLFAHSWRTMTIRTVSWTQDRWRTGQRVTVRHKKHRLCWHWLVIRNNMFVVVTKADDAYYYSYSPTTLLFCWIE